MPLFRATSPLRGIALLLLLSVSTSHASPRDREASGAEAAPVATAPAPSTSAKDALGSNAPSDAAFLFTLVARKATLEADPNHNSSVILKLVDANPHVLWFTDKPQRAAGALDAEVFLSKSFNANNGTGPWLGEPNAVVLASGPGLKRGKYGSDDEAAVVTLRDPKIDAKTGEMTFRAEIIRNEAASNATDEGEKEGKKKNKKYSADVSSTVARNYLKAGEPRPGDEGTPGDDTRLLSSPPKKKVTWENVQVFVDDYYLEQPAASPAPPPPPPPTVVVVEAPPPPPPPPPSPASSYQSSIWNRIDGPQPVDAYGCQWTGGCGYGVGFGGFGAFG